MPLVFGTCTLQQENVDFGCQHRCIFRNCDGFCKRSSILAYELHWTKVGFFVLFACLPREFLGGLRPLDAPQTPRESPRGLRPPEAPFGSFAAG